MLPPLLPEAVVGHVRLHVSALNLAAESFGALEPVVLSAEQTASADTSLRFRGVAVNKLVFR